MPAPDRIRASRLEGRIRELVADSKSSREIAAILTASGHKISHETVAKFIREETAERREAAKSVAVADAQSVVPFITDGLQRLARVAMKRAEAEDVEDGNRARLIAAGNSTLATLHKIVVGDEPQKSGVELLAELGDILDRRRRRTE